MNEESIGILLIGALLLVLVANIFYGFGEERKEKEAVKANVAEYYLDADNQRQFRFLTEPKEELNPVCNCK